jgi:hypothetical protein
MGLSLFVRAVNDKKAAGSTAESILAELKSSRIKSWDSQVAVVESLAALKDAKDVELCQPAVRCEAAYRRFPYLPVLYPVTPSVRERIIRSVVVQFT